MIGGYMGRYLWVDLSNDSIRVESLEETLLLSYIGGYGIASRVFYNRMRVGVDPLGPDNLLGFLTGPLTGSPTQTGTRWTVACKSPLTGGWGDANGSGFFGVKLKAAGFDGFFFTGIAEKPVYLYVADGQAELRDASHLWGKDCYEVDDWVKAVIGDDAEAACIGPAGERLSLISAVIHAKGRAAARSGVGAVMGAKRLKAVVVRGNEPLPVADPSRARAARQKYGHEMNSGTGFSDSYRTTGTPGFVLPSILGGDAPTMNWGSSVLKCPSPESLAFEDLVKLRVKRKACWHCPISCWGTSAIDAGGKRIEVHQPEYETTAAFGSNLLNNMLGSIIQANDICNRNGLDTISAGACLAFAFDCFEHGLLSGADTGGLELTWGNADAILLMLEKIVRREDFGDVLADGVMRAARALGPEAEPFAIHAGGQELPMHDPRFEPGLAVIYKLDATPGRHTQASQYFTPQGFQTVRPQYGVDRGHQKGRGRWVKEAACLNHAMNASGACLFGYLSTTVEFVADFLSAVSGREYAVQDLMETGERIANMRQAFNVREGINAVTQANPWRAYGYPPLDDGPTAGVHVELDDMVREHLEEMGWTLDAAIPKLETLERLGLHDVARDLWPRASS